ncbi:MAG: TlpA family protein disulfide reductase [Gammaproteobacteria bacterium]|nr:TlpA family protein disulfide reductase [Gammaproteobacteria bacterium]
MPPRTTGPRPTLVGAALFLVCLFATLGAVDTIAGAAQHDWRTVQSYLDEERAWRRNAKEGAHPEITGAVAAAKAIIATPDHPKTTDAAMFLMAYPPGVSPTGEADVIAGEQALAAHVGPDWSVLEAFLATVGEGMSEIAAEDLSDHEKLRRIDALHYRPIAAAIAILKVDGHPKTREAAELLVSMYNMVRCQTRYVILGAETLRARFPEYDDWPAILLFLESCGRTSSDAAAAVNRFYETMAVESADPAVRGIARYYLAQALKRSINAPRTTQEDREATRRSALKWATDLSAGVEEVKLNLRYGPGNRPGVASLAQAEEQLVHSIQHATVGGQIPEVAGKGLDGMEEKLSDFAGKTVLVDFWATWCVPCIAGLPDLRRLNADLPADRFATLSISVDEHLETVAEFHKNEPMPWSNWHVGNASDVARILDVRGYPTYLLLDGQGLIRGRSGTLSDRFLSLVRNTVLDAGAQP